VFKQDLIRWHVSRSETRQDPRDSPRRKVILINMPKHRPDPNDFEMMTLSFRVLGRWHKVVHAAAQRMNLSADQYMRRVVIDWACSDMGIPAPDHSALVAGPGQVAKAAAIAGMSVKDFTAHAVREAAAKAIEASATPRVTRPTDAPPQTIVAPNLPDQYDRSKSGERQRGRKR